MCDLDKLHTFRYNKLIIFLRQSSMTEKSKAIFTDIQKIVLPKDASGYGYKYTSLDALHAQIKPVLAKHDVTVNYVLDGARIALELNSVKVSELDLSLMLGGTMSPAQQMGSAITYARRYLLVAYFDLLADEDVDGATVEQLKDRNSYKILYPSKDATEAKEITFEHHVSKNGKKYFKKQGQTDYKKFVYEGDANYDGIAMQVKFQLGTEL